MTVTPAQTYVVPGGCRSACLTILNGLGSVPAKSSWTVTMFVLGTME